MRIIQSFWKYFDLETFNIYFWIESHTQRERERMRHRTEWFVPRVKNEQGIWDLQCDWQWTENVWMIERVNGTDVTVETITLCSYHLIFCVLCEPCFRCCFFSVRLLFGYSLCDFNFVCVVLLQACIWNLWSDDEICCCCCCCRWYYFYKL